MSGKKRRPRESAQGTRHTRLIQLLKVAGLHGKADLKYAGPLGCPSRVEIARPDWQKAAGAFLSTRTSAGVKARMLP
jgi:hypothetical protein